MEVEIQNQVDRAFSNRVALEPEEMLRRLNEALRKRDEKAKKFAALSPIARIAFYRHSIRRRQQRMRAWQACDMSKRPNTMRERLREARRRSDAELIKIESYKLREAELQVLQSIGFSRTYLDAYRQELDRWKSIAYNWPGAPLSDEAAKALSDELAR